MNNSASIGTDTECAARESDEAKQTAVTAGGGGNRGTSSDNRNGGNGARPETNGKQTENQQKPDREPATRMAVQGKDHRAREDNATRLRRATAKIRRASQQSSQQRTLAGEPEPYETRRIWRTTRNKRELERPSEIDGVHGDWLDEEGFVKPEYRERVAALRIRKPMLPWGEVEQYAQMRNEETTR